MLRVILLFTWFSAIYLCSYAQGYLHTDGKKIVNGNGEEIILRGIGTGNWFLQEGYMMKTSEFAGTQYAFKKKLTETIGKDRTDAFYKSWLDNHFTRTDADSMKAWGFNSVRVAMHYKWLTLPIENEPVSGQDTWLEEGFVRLDSLLDWCRDNQMYLILDLHGAPGGQGKDANISDYDPSKPSLWESYENRRKTVALWSRLARRYANEPWIGGYDLINEPNWDLPGGNALRQLYIEITNAVRGADPNHMIIIEGNWFANDYAGLTPPWDNNMVYSGHKYWTYNNPGDLNYLLNMRDNWNVPVWLGESGENSNSWFTNLIELCEMNKVGWSWWPVKKEGINNVLEVTESQKYSDLISFWRNGFPAMTADLAFDAVMEWSDKHKIKNCMVKRDVIDAMIRQPHTTSTIPFSVYKPGDPVNAVNYDLGRSSYAYRDADSANYHLSSNTYTAWNKGWAYRNDGVDIEKCTDLFPGGNGYSVGWTETGEWMQYTIDADSTAGYTLTLRSASNDPLPGIVRFTLNGTDICSPLQLPNTGGWNIWNSTTAANVIIPKGRNKMRLFFEHGGSNINLFSFTNPVHAGSVPFNYVSSETSNGNEVIITLNKDITTFNALPSDFQITANGYLLVTTKISLLPGLSRKLVVSLSTSVGFMDNLSISYNASSVKSGGSFLEPFTYKTVYNNLPGRLIIPGRIEAENYNINIGFQLEICTDTGGGKNTAFANNGDYLDYYIYVPTAGAYQVLFRIASLYSNGIISIMTSTGSSYQTIGSMIVPNTGGWQVWSSQSIQVILPAGNIILRLYSTAGEYNINWFSISSLTGIGENTKNESLKVFPNPGNGIFRLETPWTGNNKIKVQVVDISGAVVYLGNPLSVNQDHLELNLSHLVRGLYCVQVYSPKGVTTAKLVIQ